LSWTRGRLLASYGANTYTYNVNGIRTSKTVSGITKDYILDGDHIIAEKWSNGTNIYYVYNANGIAGFVYNGIPYVYQKNVFGDIVAIYNYAGGKVAGYRYNAYGECYIYNPQLDANSNGATIAEINPFRYRGYYYDSETGLYYLQSRYYDPAMGRFLNADTVDYLDPKVINGINLYSYSLNNPVQYSDPTGHFWVLFGMGFFFGLVIEFSDDISDGKVDTNPLNYLISGFSNAFSWSIGGSDKIKFGVKIVADIVIGTTADVGKAAANGQEISLYFIEKALIYNTIETVFSTGVSHIGKLKVISNQYLKELGFAQKVGKQSFNVFKKTTSYAGIEKVFDDKIVKSRFKSIKYLDQILSEIYSFYVAML